MNTVAELPTIEAMFDTMKTAPNRVQKHSPGPNPQIDLDDWRATVNGTRWTRTTKPRPAHERFWEKVDIQSPGECWYWTGGISDTGYGMFWDGTRLIKAHRFLVSVPEGMVVDHICHNGSGCAGGPTCRHRSCVNPLHLAIVTFRENVQRGMAGLARPKWKTHCYRGHKYSGDNQYIDPKGNQRCRQCASDIYTKRKAKA